MSLLKILKKGVPKKETNKKVSTNLIRQFYLNLDEPHRIWKPTEHISGEANLELQEDIINVRIKLSLIGELKVKMRASHPTTIKTKKKIKLIEKSTYLYGSPSVDEDSAENGIVNGLSKGTHKFPFKITIPNSKNSKKLFSSIKFERGSIYYYLQCSVERTDNKSTNLASCEADFQLIVPLDVTEYNQPKTKSVVLQSAAMVRHHNVDENGTATSSMFTKMTNNSNSSNGSSSSSSNENKTVSISVTLPKSGFTIGETIPVKINLKHYKPYYHLAGVITTLVRICRVGGINENEPTETFRKDICQNVSPIYIDKETLGFSCTALLKIPYDTFSSFNELKNFFTFQYYIEVMVNLSRKNLIYTESNKIIGGGDTDAKSEQGLSDVDTPKERRTSSKMATIEKSIQKKVLNLINHSSNTELITIDDNNELRSSNMTFKDMVDVENLKRLRNVTGMSIEIIVGTTRIDDTESVKEIDPPQEQERAYQNNDLNEWLCSSIYDNNIQPVPEYTPATSDFMVSVADDKQELERSRLKELEDEPDPY
ncbi:hypothetical protein KAFR_0F03130 [Kazachstania africana CBS 2517]|uniref:pH-response regulator protein palF/RIM8 n=1 Tax=Kazachstania africana (strain ATCC 22294 / BCRC 22015 / CBS 2517 / CECT 1963 / NBRC 1671 / NRRL Y-8276) TaxID=1071382 RepID=H2AX09_KAZAF|nr:hypothetical protein KAFR_0F03130 [Kazachstania africana CBS 2517]CCF58909.1 hypothetical protein KAFR_0F03130 [Kazachstania africana CBS 2517]